MNEGGHIAGTDSILLPFRGIRYRTADPQELSSLMAPPYDVISESMQAELHALHPHNFVRVELPEDGADRYQRAGAVLRRWLDESVLVRERTPALYLLEQEFRVGDRTLRRRGVFGLVKLPEAGEHYVLAHEGTLSEPKADRLQLTRACKAMTSPILLMTEDPEAHLIERLEQVKEEPEAVAEDTAGVIHRVWTLQDSASTAAVCAAIGSGPLFMADGHHRFETALAFRDEMRQATPEAVPEAGFNYALALVTSAQDDGLEILPTHRLVACPDEEGKEAMKAFMGEHFEVHRLDLPDPKGLGWHPWLECRASHRHVFGAYCGDGNYYVLIARDDMVSPSQSVVERLDVSILHRYLIDPLLADSGQAPDADGRISHDAQPTGTACRGARLRYVSDEEQAIAAVERGDYDFALFLRPTRISDVMAAARAGERMPGKSTYFYPKVPAGIVISDASAEPL